VEWSTLAPGLAHKYKTRMRVADNDKHTSFLHCVVFAYLKMLYSLVKYLWARLEPTLRLDVILRLGWVLQTR
jgi:hypothetical protein